jgi:hypothetical protein
VAEITGMLELSSWPKGMRVIVRKERPHPGARLRFTDIDGAARRWEAKRLRQRLCSAAARIICGGRRLRPRIAATWPWATQITAALTRLQALGPG